MCGICGFTGFSFASVLPNMVDSLTHRGPDDKGLFCQEQISLGMRRLSIVDVETGQQPVHNEDKTIYCVFNGEIYNFIELKQQLINKGHVFYTDHSDTEVIVHAYEEYGLDFAHHLNGMFAIALWDKRSDRLILIRDRMGVKPLFYTQQKGQLIFASEIKAILRHPEVPKNPNLEALYHYFSYKNTPSPLTAFQDIYAVRPGERLVFSANKLTKEWWWRPDWRKQTELSFEAAQERLLALLENATQLRMRTDVPFGAFLSGGVDSTAVVALMSRLQGKQLKTFSLGYEDDLKSKNDDCYFARRMSDYFGTDHYEYRMSSRTLRDEIPEILSSFDQPFSGTVSTFVLSRLIAKHVKVALSGDGADELFGSYLTHRTAIPMEKFTRWRQNNPQAPLSALNSNAFLPATPDFLNRLYEQSGGDETLWKYHLLMSTDQEKQSYLSGDFLSQLPRETSTLTHLKQRFGTLQSREPLNRILELEWQTQFSDQVLGFVDHLSMAHSVEVRSPFIDYRLAEFAMQLPDYWKIQHDNVKHILKSALSGIVPTEILTRPKEGFVLPVYHWMAKQLKPYVLETLSIEALNKHQLLNTKAVQQLLEAYYDGKPQYAGKVWNLMMFQIWWDLYFA